jgi:hypothetical protein
VTGTSRLSNDTLQLVDLRLGTTESTELFPLSVSSQFTCSRMSTYPLLRQLTCTLVLGVSEEFDNATLVWCKSVQSQLALIPTPISASHYQNGDVPRNLLDDLPNEGSAFAQVPLSSADSWLDDSGLGFLYA